MHFYPGFRPWELDDYTPNELAALIGALPKEPVT